MVSSLGCIFSPFVELLLRSICSISLVLKLWFAVSFIIIVEMEDELGLEWLWISHGMIKLCSCGPPLPISLKAGDASGSWA